MIRTSTGVFALCLLAGCAMPPQSGSTQTASAKANCKNAAPATGSHIVDESDCDGASSRSMKHAILQSGTSGNQVYGGNH